MWTIGGIIFQNEVTNKMIINKLSNKAKMALLGELDNYENEPEIKDVLASLVDVANQLDSHGFCEAADEIDALVEEKLKKMAEPGRLQAKQLRRKFAQGQYYTRGQLEALLKGKWKTLTEKFKNKARNMRTTFVKRELDKIVQRWIDTKFGTGGK